MLIIPAIDLRGGKCVRLKQGDYAQETIYGDDPVAMAQHWADQGATYLHLVDLDGARLGVPANLAIVGRMIQAAGVPCELGGGLRTEAAVELAFQVGVDRVVIGTQAFKKPGWFRSMAEKYPGKVLLGLDAKNGMVATEGWLEVSERRAVDLAKEFGKLRLAGVVYTDISRDGMLEGPNFAALQEMNAAVPFPIIASGGISTLGDIRLLNRMPIAACIVGKALYEGKLDLQAAIQVADH